jgi:hypothetical protein
LVMAAQKSFRYMRLYKAACVEVYSKLLIMVEAELIGIGKEQSIPVLANATKMSEKQSRDLVSYLFEYYLWTTMKQRFIHSDKAHRSFGTLELRLRQRDLQSLADHILEEKPRVELTYPRCVNIDRLRSVRKLMVDNDLTQTSTRNKKREDEIKKLSEIFVSVKKRFKLLRFAFDFDDIDAKLAVLRQIGVDYYQSESIENAVFGREYSETIQTSPSKIAQSFNN